MFRSDRWKRKSIFQTAVFTKYKTDFYLGIKSLFQVNSISVQWLNAHLTLSWWSHSLNHSCTAGLELYYFELLAKSHLYKVTIFISIVIITIVLCLTRWKNSISCFYFVENRFHVPQWQVKTKTYFSNASFCKI